MTKTNGNWDSGQYFFGYLITVFLRQKQKEADLGYVVLPWGDIIAVFIWKVVENSDRITAVL